MSEVARVSDHSGVRVPRAFFVLNMPGGSLNRRTTQRGATPAGRRRSNADLGVRSSFGIRVPIGLSGRRGDTARDRAAGAGAHARDILHAKCHTAVYMLPQQ